MGRYILLKVDSNDKAELLIERLKVAPSVQLIGLFAFGKSHCDRKGDCAGSTELIRSSKWGTLHCPNCKLPLSTLMQTPRNLLIDPDLHPRYRDIFLNIREPYEHPDKKYGVEALKISREITARGAEIIRKHRLKERRGRRRRSVR